MFLIMRMFENHHLPQAGGILDQDPEFLKAALLIEGELGRLEQEEDKRKEMNKNWKPT